MSDRIETASQLPLQDAAYLLWRLKSELDRESVPPNQSSKARAFLSNPEAVARLVRSVTAKIIFEQDHAEFGPTFDRLKKAHPDVADDDVRAAIREAVKFDTDCITNFSYSKSSLWGDAEHAVDKALLKHPGYSDETREDAIYCLVIAMK